jgi:hypothetical protein
MITVGTEAAGVAKADVGFKKSCHDVANFADRIALLRSGVFQRQSQHLRSKLYSRRLSAAKGEDRRKRTCDTDHTCDMSHKGEGALFWNDESDPTMVEKTSIAVSRSTTSQSERGMTDPASSRYPHALVGNGLMSGPLTIECSSAAWRVFISYKVLRI